MWKKILFGLIIAAFLGVSYFQFENVNIYNAPATIQNKKGRYNKNLTSSPNSVLSDYQRILFKPSVKKVYDKKNKNTFLQVTIPYKISSHFKVPVNKYTENVSNSIRVGAGGTVWMANPHKSVTITPKHSKASGSVTVDLFIQDGYPEKRLLHYKVYFVDQVNATQTQLYLVS